MTRPTKTMKTRGSSKSKNTNDAWRPEDKALAAQQMGAEAYRPFADDKDHGEEHLHRFGEQRES